MSAIPQLFLYEEKKRQSDICILLSVPYTKQELWVIQQLTKYQHKNVSQNKN